MPPLWGPPPAPALFWLIAVCLSQRITNIRTRLEAFVHEVRQYARSHGHLTDSGTTSGWRAALQAASIARSCSGVST